MSAGFVHMRASIMLCGGFIIGGLIYKNVDCFQYASGALLGIMFTPDLDVDNGFIGNKIIRERIGGLAEHVWDFIWYPYRKSLKHGGPLSHFPIIGTIGRLAYLYFILIVVPHCIYYYVAQPSWNLQYALECYFEYIVMGWRIILALMCSDLIHWTLDILTTEHSGEK